MVTNLHTTPMNVNEVAETVSRSLKPEKESAEPAMHDMVTAAAPRNVDSVSVRGSEILPRLEEGQMKTRDKKAVSAPCHMQHSKVALAFGFSACCLQPEADRRMCPTWGQHGGAYSGCTRQKGSMMIAVTVLVINTRVHVFMHT